MISPLSQFFNCNLPAEDRHTFLWLLYHRRRFLLITVVVYFPTIFTYVGFNVLGLTWYAIDVALPLMYFFILLTGLFFVVYATFSAVIIQRLQHKIDSKDNQDVVE